MCLEKILILKMKSRLKYHLSINNKNNCKIYRLIITEMKMMNKTMNKTRKLILISYWEMQLLLRQNLMKIEKMRNLMMMMKIIVSNILRPWLIFKKRKKMKMKYGNILLIDTAKNNLKLCIK